MSNSLPSPNFLAGGGAMGAKIRAFDWSQTELNEPGIWPEALKTLTSVMLTAGQPMFIAWGPRRLLLYNDSYAPLLGRKEGGALGNPFAEVWSEAWEDVGPLFDKVFAGEPVHMENLRLTLDRREEPSEAFFTFSYTPVRDDSGNIAGLFCPCWETTAEVLAEQNRVKERDRQFALFLQMPGFVAVLAGPEHIYEYVNEAYLELTGPRHFIGRSVKEVLPELAGQGFYELLDQVYASGERVIAHSMPASLTGEPSPRYIDFVYEPIRDDLGKTTGIFVGGYDVTTHTEATAALREMNENLEARILEAATLLVSQEALIKTFFEHSSECHAILIDDGNGKFRYEEINPATLRLYNMTRDQVIGHTTNEMFGEAQADEMNAHFNACLKTLTPYRYEREQGNRIVEAIATPVPDAAGITRRIVVSARDVTERRALEQQLRQSQKMEAVGQLTGGLAHDFNNLLTGISGSLEMLEARLAQGRVHDLDRYLVAARGASKRAAALTHRLLAFSRRQTLDPKPTDANRLIADLTELIRRTAGPIIHLEFIAGAGLWLTAVDANQLENAILNLCINARDAMPDGGRLTIETTNKWLDERGARERDLSAGQYITVCITDTGAGMPADVVARAFDPFFTTKPLGEGTGLGLSMVYGFVRQSGGQARIYSELDKGTMVCLYLPRYYGNDEDIEQEAKITDALLSEHGEVVLVVDDEPTVRMLVGEILADLGYRTLEADDGKSGLKILESSSHIDLLITDVGLPGGINGRQLADVGLALRPGLKVLFITGYAENAVIGDGHLKRGMHVVTKPFALEALATRIKSIISSDRL
jgi:PAS domain S-box-containing protein